MQTIVHDDDPKVVADTPADIANSLTCTTHPAIDRAPEGSGSVRQLSYAAAYLRPVVLDRRSGFVGPLQSRGPGEPEIPIAADPGRVVQSHGSAICQRCRCLPGVARSQHVFLTASHFATMEIAT